jgi:hypothetical protein
MSMLSIFSIGAGRDVSLPVPRYQTILQSRILCKIQFLTQIFGDGGAEHFQTRDMPQTMTILCKSDFGLQGPHSELSASARTGLYLMACFRFD